MSENSIIVICVTVVNIVLILAIFTDFFNNLFKKSK